MERVTIACAIAKVVTDLRGTVLISFENLSVLFSRNLFSRFFMRSGPRMSVRIYSRGIFVRKRDISFAIVGRLTQLWVRYEENGRVS